MQVGVTQIIVPDLSMHEFFRQAAETGYEVVEIMMRPQGDLTPQSDAAQLANIVAEAKAAGVEIVSMTHSHCSGNLLDEGDSQQRSIADTIVGLRAAAAMGIDCTLHCLGGLRSDLYYVDAYRNAVEALKVIAVTAEELGVTLAIEFVWSGFLFSPLEMRNFLDEIGSDRIGFYFDPGNMAVFQYPHHWLRALGQHTKMVHVKDWRGRALDGSWPALLEGEVDFPLMNAELRAIGYDGPMISEVPPSVAPLAKTAESIRKIIKM
jgi:L-ribulose-5-phosphate 3-epimerase